jgi:hypothetical protein
LKFYEFYTIVDEILKFWRDFGIERIQKLNENHIQPAGRFWLATGRYWARAAYLAQHRQLHPRLASQGTSGAPN